jgi:hypothetical protein
MVMRVVRTRFVCIGEGGIGAFVNDEENTVYTVSLEGGGWEPRFTHCPTMLISMEDICPAMDLADYEFRTYNEHFLQEMLKKTRGDGVLTIVHRIGWQWHFGMAWSRKPLIPKSPHLVTSKPPRWWDAEDVFCEGPTYEELEARLDQAAYDHARQWERMSIIRHQTEEEARGVLGEEADDHDVQNFARELRGEPVLCRPPPRDPNAPTFEQRLEAALAGIADQVAEVAVEQIRRAA